MAGDRALGVVVTAVALGLAGCGSSGSPTPPAASTTTPAGQGRELFVSTGCASCHTLADAGSTGQVGPDLDDAHPTAAKVRRQVTNGGSGMPSFRSSLTPEQVRLLAAYVSGATSAPADRRAPAAPGPR